MKPHEQHRDHSRQSLNFHLVTVSSTRFKMKSEGSQYEDEAGDLAAHIVEDAGHKIDTRRLLPDNKSKIRGAVRDFLDSDSSAIVFIGGTGVSHSDVTVETVVPFFEKELTGFGELLRNISYQKIGSAAMLTRATAGTAKGKLIVCLPGSPGAVETALQNFISEFPHIVLVASGKLDTGSSV